MSIKIDEMLSYRSLVRERLGSPPQNIFLVANYFFKLTI